MTETAITTPAQEEVLFLRPSRGWSALNLADLWRYRELIYFLIWRDIKVRYKQTALGALWAIIQPIVTMIVFTFFFGRLARVSSEDIPYPLFSFAGLLPWGLFSKALADAGHSMLANRNMITKVYFPRLVIPMSTVLSGVVDFAIAFVVLIGLMLYYNGRPVQATQTSPAPVVASAPAQASQTDGEPAPATSPAPAEVYRIQLTPALLTLPLFLLLALVTALGVGLWLSALNVIYRDVNQVLPFLTQIWLFLTPIAYSSKMISAKWQMVYALNPMAGVVEGFRWALLGTQTPPGLTLAISTAIALITLVTGLFYFRRMERTFADQI